MDIRYGTHATYLYNFGFTKADPRPFSNNLMNQIDNLLSTNANIWHLLPVSEANSWLILIQCISWNVISKKELQIRFHEGCNCVIKYGLLKSLDLSNYSLLFSKRTRLIKNRALSCWKNGLRKALLWTPYIHTYIKVLL